jgi:hypothetical protein
LIDTVDATTRAAVAARLASYPAAPPAVLHRLGVATGAEPVQTSEGKREADLAELFFAAGSEERRLILTNLDAVEGTTPQRSAVPGEVIACLENAALQRHTGEFCRALERALGISGALAKRIAHDPAGEPIVVAAKALGMKSATLQRILLFLNPQVGQSVERVYALARLYDEITPAAAERMLTIWRQAGSERKPRHEPLHWDDTRSSARSRATHAGHRIARSRDPLSSRTRSNER